MENSIQKNSILQLFPHGEDIAFPAEAAERLIDHLKDRGLTVNSDINPSTSLRIILLNDTDAGPRLLPCFSNGNRVELSDVSLEAIEATIAVPSTGRQLTLALIDLEIGDPRSNFRTAIRHDVDVIVVGAGAGQIAQEVDETMKDLSLMGHVVVCIRP